MSAALDAETGLADAPHGHKEELRLWLRLLTCATLIESEVRRRLRAEFCTTLPRFDLLAALDRAPGGLTPGEVSRRMMVSSGNVTGLATRLEAEGLIERRAHHSDGRAAAASSRDNPPRTKPGSRSCSRMSRRATGASCSACSAARNRACAPA
jgi:hypothetical protein